MRAPPELESCRLSDRLPRMIVFLFYISAILIVLTLCAAVADALGHFFPDWLDEQADAVPSVEDLPPTEGSRSSAR